MSSRINYTIFDFSKIANEDWHWVYSANEIQNKLCELFKGHLIKDIYVQLNAYLSSDHLSANCIDLSCEGGGCIIVFDNYILDLGIHARGQFIYRIVSFDDVSIKHTKDYPPNDYNELIDCYYNISYHNSNYKTTDICVNNISVKGTDMWCFPINGFDEDKAKVSANNNDLPAEIDLITNDCIICLIGDDLEYLRLVLKDCEK